jgi:hypothetical protein
MSLIKVRVLVGLVTVVGLIFAAVLFFYAASPYIYVGVVPFFHSAVRDMVIFGLAGVCCLYVCARLMACRPWAWWATTLLSVLVLVTGLFLAWATIHPRDDFARSEGGFGFFLSILLTLPSAFCLSILNLPIVRRSFFSKSKT